MKKVTISVLVAVGLLAVGGTVLYAQLQETPVNSQNAQKEIPTSPVTDEVSTTEESITTVAVEPKQQVQAPTSTVSPNSTKSLKNVKYYKKTSPLKPNTPKAAMTAIQKSTKRQVPAKPDIQDATYREMVTIAATNLDTLTPTETEAIITYAKEVDKYENQLKNQQIKALETKIQSGTALSNEEYEKLESLTPVIPGQKLDKESFHSAQQPSQPNQSKQSNESKQSHKNFDQKNVTHTNKPLQAQPSTITKAPAKYNPFVARDYAYKWWNQRNNKQYGYYSRVSGGCYNCWPDCTNFVSQAIKSGGIEERKTGSYWYYNDTKPSYAWGVANSFYKHFKARAKEAKYFRELSVGDVVNVDFDHDGDIEHSAIITKIDYYDAYVTQHSSDKKDIPISKWLYAGYDVYAWKMATANQR